MCVLHTEVRQQDFVSTALVLKRSCDNESVYVQFYTILF